jgi:TonB family protein
VSLRGKRRWLAAVLLVISLGALWVPKRSWGQQPELARKVKSKVMPLYPELARRMGITGVVKIQVVVAPNGSVKNAKVVGGHPVLTPAAMDAVRKWRFEPASEETTGVVEFKFDPSALTE